MRKTEPLKLLGDFMNFLYQKGLTDHRSPSYFAGSCGGAPLEIIKQYIEQQETPS